MIEAAKTSETSVNFYQTTRRYKPEDSHLRNHRHENLKSYLRCGIFIQNGIKEKQEKKSGEEGKWKSERS
jgi:hypothetical protein